MPDIFVESAIFDPIRQKFMVLGQLNQGDLFGEQSALNDLPNPFSVVACSPKVEYYKIHRSNFSSYFGGSNGEQVSAMRALMIIQQNWLGSKLQAVEYMDVSRRMNTLEFCSDHDLNRDKPKLTVLKEVPFMKNNPRLMEA